MEFDDKYQENPAFHDVFTDVEMLDSMLSEKSFSEVVANLMAFTLHSNFNKKTAVKKETVRKR